VGFSLHVSKEGRRLTEKLRTAKGSSGCHSIRLRRVTFPSEIYDDDNMMFAAQGKQKETMTLLKGPEKESSSDFLDNLDNS
jgi:hypothetical protein